MITPVWRLRLASTSVTRGPCDTGSACASNRDCDEGTYCVKETCDATTGTCEDRPARCTTLPDEACGCDGETYTNPCFAALAGVNVASAGACDGTEFCADNGDCASDMYCAKDGC